MTPLQQAINQADAALVQLRLTAEDSDLAQEPDLDGAYEALEQLHATLFHAAGPIRTAWAKAKVGHAPAPPETISLEDLGL